MNPEDFQARTPAKVEPTADHRTIAKFVRQMHTALVDEGFTELQANKIVAEMMTSMGRPSE